jgi:drug/metabolite transporter (DMT)-like permease
MPDRPPGTAENASAPEGTAAMRWLLLATMAVWGLNLSVVKLLIERFEPMLIAVLRMAVAAIAISVVLYWRRLPWPRFTPRELGLVAVCAVLMVYLNQFLFTEGVARTAATNAALIIALNPLVSALVAALLLGDRMTPRRLAGVALGFGGVAMVVLNRSGAALATGGVGDALVLASVLSWVLGGALVRGLATGRDSAAVSWAVHGTGTLMLAADLLLLRPLPLAGLARFGVVDAGLLVLSGVFATGIGALVWNRALVTLGVARTSLYVYWVPIFGVAFGVLLLGEPLTLWHLGGLAGVLAGTWLGTGGGHAR